MFGLEATPITKKQKMEFEVAEPNLLRCSLEGTRRDKIRYQYIRRMVQVRKLGDKARKARML